MSTKLNCENVYILSVQSHVLFGYVGNKVAAFTLQASGFPTDTIDTVRFSNHSHYENRTGEVLKPGEMSELMRGVELNKLDCRYTHVLSGYSPNEVLLDELLVIIGKLKQINPHLQYVCDPVLGDNGRLYVTEKLVQAYRDRALPQADIITPNQFEAELLSGIQIKDDESAINCLNKLHSFGPSVVVITSTSLSGHANQLVAFASYRSKSNTSQTRLEQWKIKVPEKKVYFVGTGDTFASCFLAWWIKLGDLKSSFEHTIASVQGVLQTTQDYASKLPQGTDSIANRELRLPNCIEHIIKPTVACFAEPIVLNSN